MDVTNALLKKLNESSADMVKLRRCLCGSMLKIHEHTQRWYSGKVNYDETLCDACRVEFSDKARIVCRGCKRLQGFIDPNTAKTGFKFVGKRHYHLAKCPQCSPGIVATPVIEHEVYCAERKIPTKTNQDLIQEIEQKHLMGKVAADKLRRELNPSKL